MKRWYHIIGFLFVICNFIFYSTVDVFGIDLKDYKDAKYNFEVKYPADWQVENINNMVVFVSNLEDEKDYYREYVSVGVEDISAYPISLDNYVEYSFQNWQKQASDLKLRERRRTKIDDKEVIYIICELNKTKYKQYYFIHNNKAYVLTYAADLEDFDKFLESAEALIHSLKLSN